MKIIKKGVSLALLFLASITISSCKKSDTTSATKNNAQLIVGMFSRTKVEVSNSGTAWKDLTASYVGESLTFSADGSYVDKEGSATDSGYWEIPLNGDTLIKGALSFSITTLDAHTLVLVLTYAYPVSASDGNLYKYWRFSYSR